MGDNLHRTGVDFVPHLCLNIEDVEKVLNDFQSRFYGGNMFGQATTQKILRVGYFWPSIFKDLILVDRKCHDCQIHSRKEHAPPSPLHPVVTAEPFEKC